VSFVAMSRGSDSFIAPDIAQRPANTPAKPSGDHIPLGGFVLTSMRPMMIADRCDHFRIFQSPKPEWRRSGTFGRHSFPGDPLPAD
jgi:hypothetical protein